MSCPAPTDRRNQIQLFHFSLCSPLALISLFPSQIPFLQQNIWMTMAQAWHPQQTRRPCSAPAPLSSSVPSTRSPFLKIDRKENKMTGIHIISVKPRDYTGKLLFPHTKGSITARWPLVIVFLNLPVRHPGIGDSMYVLAGVCLCVCVCVCVCVCNCACTRALHAVARNLSFIHTFFPPLFLLSCLQWLHSRLFLARNIPAFTKCQRLG